MAADISAKIGIDGEKAFRDSLAAINSQMKNLGSEMKAVVSSFAGMEDSEEAVTAKNNVLQKSIEVSVQKMSTLQTQSDRAKKRLAALADELEAAKHEFGENSAEATKAQNAYNRQVTVVNKLETQINSTRAEMSRMSGELSAMKQKQEEAAAAANKAETAFERISSVIKSQSSELAELKRQYSNAVLEFGDTSKEADELSQKIIQLSAELNENKTKIKMATKAADSLERVFEDVRKAADDTGDDLKKAGKEADEAGNSFRDAFAGGTVSGAVQSMASSIASLVDKTTEYRKIMGTLDTSSQKAGYSAEQTEATYKQLYGVLGDTQQSATTVANLQALQLNQDKLKQMTDGVIGAWATYGDSIPIDGLAEAVNETAKVGKVTDTFADVLNWAGTSEDAFNAKLEAAGSQAERVNIILEELNNQGLTSAAEKWRENNTEIVAANEASANLEQTTGRLGEMLSPMVTGLKEGLNGVLSTVLDMVESGNPLIAMVAGLTVALAGLGLATFITQGAAAAGTIEKMKTTFATLNTVMKANPILLVVSLLAGLAAALVTAYQTNEEFRNKVDAVWEALKGGVGDKVEAVIGFIDGLDRKFQSFIDWLDGLPDDLKAIGGNIIDGFWNGVDEKAQWLKDKVTSLVDMVKGIFTGSSGFDTHSPSKWSDKVAGWVLQAIGDRFVKDKTAVKGAETAVDAVKEVFDEGAEEIADMPMAAVDGMEAVLPYIKRTAQRVGDVLQKELNKTNDEIEALQKKANEEQAAKELKQYKESIAEKQKELAKAEKKNKQKILDEIAKIESDWNEKQVQAARNAEQAALQERAAALQQFQQEYESAISSIESKQESLQDKLSDYGSLFERVETEEGKELFQMGDLDAEIKKIQKYSEAIDKMKEKGLSDGLMSEISSMSVDDALDYMDRLSSMSDVKFEQYMQKYDEKQRLAAEAAEKFYQGEFTALEQAYTEKLPEALGGVKEELYRVGAQAAESFASGMAGDSEAGIAGAVSEAVTSASEATQGPNMQQIVSGMKGQEDILTGYIQELEAKLLELMASSQDDYIDIGEMMMDGLADGIRNGQSGVVNAVARVVAAAVKKAKKDLDISSPSGVFKGFGKFSMEGYEEGIKGKLQSVVRTMQNSMAMVTKVPKAATVTAGGNIDKSRTYTYGDINVHVDSIKSEREAKVLAQEIEFIRRQEAAGKGDIL